VLRKEFEYEENLRGHRDPNVNTKYRHSTKDLLEDFTRHLRHTFGDVLKYAGTTTETEEVAGKIHDIDVLVVLSHLSEGDISFTWRIIDYLHLRYNIFVDCRLYSQDDLDDQAKIPPINRYLLRLFLTDLVGQNPFLGYSPPKSTLLSEGLKKIVEQEAKILTAMPRLAHDRGQLRTIAQCVYDAIRAFLLIENQPVADKGKACSLFCKSYPEFPEAEPVYQGYLEPHSVVDVTSFILDSLALVKHLKLRATKKRVRNEVLLLNTPSSMIPHPRDDYLSYDHNMPLGIVCLASYLKSVNVSVKVLDAYAENLGAVSTVDRIFSQDSLPRIIGMNVSSPNIHVAHRIAAYIKRVRDDLVVVCGGPHASIAQKHTLSTGHVDYVIRGEGELPLANLAKALFKNQHDRVDSIKGVYYARSGHVVGTENDTDLLPLDEIPPPDFAVLPIDKYFSVRKRLYLHTSRGCAFRCVYCSVPSCWGQGVREIPMPRFLEQLKAALEKFIPDEIQIVDDNFSHKNGRIIEAFCDGVLAMSLRVKWKCQLRADQLCEDLVKKMAQAGCFEADFGVESGNQEIQKRIKKNLNLDKTKEVVSCVSGTGIRTKAFFMLGFPDETYQHLADSINYAITLKQNGLSDVAFFPVMPFPGTQIAIAAGREVYQGAVIDDKRDMFDRSFAGHRLRKYSAKPEVSLNQLFTPNDLRLLVKFAYQRFEVAALVTDLKEEFTRYRSFEEANAYGF